ncbi:MULTISPECIES: hypothetical protein [unclassified Streptomyces]|uniref:hypothetical protein n=1 Tax=unclassified Streptomyces TaxID=2593676 RepID=UPI00224F028C|nr:MULTISPECIES: hypothetical protein [unclassified Streptomyces]MCX5053604.1 hypothetical protein [Streptomyces sp. NBC_00474]
MTSSRASPPSATSLRISAGGASSGDCQRSASSRSASTIAVNAVRQSVAKSPDCAAG